jgi:hypothetical protein
MKKYMVILILLFVVGCNSSVKKTVVYTDIGSPAGQIGSKAKDIRLLTLAIDKETKDPNIWLLSSEVKHDANDISVLSTKIVDLDKVNDKCLQDLQDENATLQAKVNDLMASMYRTIAFWSIVGIAVGAGLIFFQQVTVGIGVMVISVVLGSASFAYDKYSSLIAKGGMIFVIGCMLYLLIPIYKWVRTTIENVKVTNAAKAALTPEAKIKVFGTELTNGIAGALQSDSTIAITDKIRARIASVENDAKKVV